MRFEFLNYEALRKRWKPIPGKKVSSDWEYLLLNPPYQNVLSEFMALTAFKFIPALHLGLYVVFSLIHFERPLSWIILFDFVLFIFLAFPCALTGLLKNRFNPPKEKRLSHILRPFIGFFFISLILIGGYFLSLAMTVRLHGQPVDTEIELLIKTILSSLVTIVPPLLLLMRM